MDDIVIVNSTYKLTSHGNLLLLPHSLCITVIKVRVIAKNTHNSRSLIGCKKGKQNHKTL